MGVLVSGSSIDVQFGDLGGSCSDGLMLAEASCLDAARQLVPTDCPCGGVLVSGSWDFAPSGCSMQMHFLDGQHGNWVVHYNRHSVGVNDGWYTPVCSLAAQPPQRRSRERSPQRRSPQRRRRTPQRRSVEEVEEPQHHEWVGGTRDSWCGQSNTDMYDAFSSSLKTWALDTNQNGGWRWCQISVEQCQRECERLGNCAGIYHTQNNCCFPTQSTCEGDTAPG